MVTRSYIKLYGPPVLEAIRTLEKVSVEIPEVSIMNMIVWREIARKIAIGLRESPVGFMVMMAELAMNYYASSGISLPSERSSSILSKSGESLGEYDFFFEWSKKPDREQLNKLIEKIDEELARLGCTYTITTK